MPIAVLNYFGIGYLTLEQRIPLGSLSTSAAISAHLTEISAPSRPNSPAINGTPTPDGIQTDPFLRTLEKAYHTRNGPLFVRTVEQISTYFKGLKDEMLKNAKVFFENPIPSNSDSAPEGTDKPEVKSKGKGKSSSGPGIPTKLWKTILEEVYQRSVGPDIDETKKYKSFSSETYGELNPMYAFLFDLTF